MDLFARPLNDSCFSDVPQKPFSVYGHRKYPFLMHSS